MQAGQELLRAWKFLQETFQLLRFVITRILENAASRLLLPDVEPYSILATFSALRAKVAGRMRYISP